MQLAVIVAIVFAIASVSFAMQNSVPTTAVFLIWRFDGSLAMVLLLALGLGVIVAGLVTSPAMIKGQWAASRLRRQVAEAERDKAELTRQIAELEAECARLSPASPSDAQAPKPYVGLKTLLSGDSAGTPKKRAVRRTSSRWSWGSLNG